MTIFFTSDNHIGHENILHLGEGRPFNSLNHMHTVMRNNWTSVVSEDDEVWVLGDIAMGNFEQSIEFFRILPGRKKLVPGNHDKIFTGSNNATRIQKFLPLYEEVGFEVLPENTFSYFETSYGTQKVAISHFPYRGDHTESLRYDKNRPVDEGLPLIHGHTHSRTQHRDELREFHVGVDSNDFTPVSEHEIVAWLERLHESNLV